MLVRLMGSIMKAAILGLGVVMVSVAVQAAPMSTQQSKAMRNAVTEEFKDPTSAQLRKIELMDGRNASKPGEGIYCGEVNAKNSYGAYTGFMPFIAAVLGDEALAINVAQDQDSVVVVRELCRRAKAGEFGQAK